MYFVDQVMCSGSDSSKHESKLYNFLHSFKLLDNQSDSRALIMSFLYGVNRTSC